MNDDENATILQKLLAIQAELKVEKGRYNEFGGFFSRSKEDILEAVKPFAHEQGCVVICDDEIEFVAENWVYVKTTARLVDVLTGEVAVASSIAREPDKKPKMDSSQTTGSAASYAGKRALGNLFALDDTADSDNEPYASDRQQGFVAACTACGTQYQFDSEEQMLGSMCRCGNMTFARA
ncbi:ERF family protein [Slackia exigua]|uniref:ERF family protein n=1 Tax=Slackia exigua TaxID=84109 RepID=UPI0028DC7A8D|nr:ERF family protein [Slackia exigua]